MAILHFLWDISFRVTDRSGNTVLHDVLGPPRHIFIFFNSCVRVRPLKKQRLPRSLYPLQNMLQKPRFLTCPPQAVFVHRPTWTCNFLGDIKKPLFLKGFYLLKHFFLKIRHRWHGMRCPIFLWSALPGLFSFDHFLAAWNYASMKTLPRAPAKDRSHQRSMPAQ